MNMFMLQTRPQWGFLVGAGAVGLPAAVLVAATEVRVSGLAWLAALTAALVGGGWAALLSLRNPATSLWRATLLGAYAWMGTTFVFSLMTLYYAFYFLATLPVAALLGAVMGAIVGAFMTWAGIQVAPPRRAIIRRKVRP
jgi:hypothetical protein